MRSNMLETVQLTAGYSGAAVVHAVSLNVAAGEIVALLGANGAGKTTTLSTIFGTLAPISGEIWFDGESIGGRPPHRNARAGIGYVPEGRALAPSLTVTENLRLVSDWKIDPFDLFPEFGPLRSRRVGLLSGGEQQMLTVARALLRMPKLLLVDELSFGLAPIIVDGSREGSRNPSR
jgi:branched-chain amino acid transport system ATP-binding protein